MEYYLEQLRLLLEDGVHADYVSKVLYATDASVYREIPMAVVYPKNSSELQKIVQWANEYSVPIIPRAAGTSLAGQVVGKGVVVDIGRFMNKIVEINVDEHYAVVQPGVIRDDLNKAVRQFGLHFAPETSTSNRCMIGGMVGNNACGAHSLVFGSTRDHVVEVKGFFSDGSPAIFKSLSDREFEDKLHLDSLEGEIYRHLNKTLSDENKRKILEANSPWPEIKRRNTGYALDLLMLQKPWNSAGDNFNMCPLIAGSEGTLMVASEIKVNLAPLLAPVTALLCAHFETLDEAFRGNLVALNFSVSSIELIDDVILSCTAEHPGLRRYRSFVKGSPKGILIIEICGHSEIEINEIAEEITKSLKAERLGYHYPVVRGKEVTGVWELRKAGLGVLSNVEGEAKPVTVIEDTAVRPIDLPNYMSDFQMMLAERGLSGVYYAHISTGELHLKPVLNLKDPAHVVMFRDLAESTAALVKKYRGSLSGEHGDGRLRGEFIRFMVGNEVFNMFKELKHTWDPNGIFNPGKIIDTPPMDTNLRYSGGYSDLKVNTVFNYGSDGGILQAIERCNGSGDCRRPFDYGGIMCPSYQATLDEKLSTRGRANVLRETLTRSSDKPYSNKALKEILDKCLSCKGCKLECPSAVDMAKYKGEVMNQFYQHHKTPFHIILIAHIYPTYHFFSKIPRLYNYAVSAKPLANIMKRVANIHPERDLPKLSYPPFRRRIKNWGRTGGSASEKKKKSVILYVDEFTELFDSQIAIAASNLLCHLNYDATLYYGIESGRAAFSTGKLNYAQKCAIRNINSLKDVITDETPLIGIEPSAILSFCDEYPAIVPTTMRYYAEKIGGNSLLIEDFLVKEFEAGNISEEQFIPDKARIVAHGHCHQKSVKPSKSIKKMLEIPVGWEVIEAPAGCCGMAGSFGMNKENYELSMKIGELSLFPFLRNQPNGTIIAVPGMSCRQQIFDGTGLVAKHPVEILAKALKTN